MGKDKKINIKKLNNNVIMPNRGTKGSSGWDIYALLEKSVFIPLHTTVKIPTGIMIEFPKFTTGLIYSRSGIATKRNLVVAQGTAVIDSDYRGELIIPLHNDSDITQWVNPNERIAQFIVTLYIPIELVEIDNLSETIRGNNGFGSTGE